MYTCGVCGDNVYFISQSCIECRFTLCVQCSKYAMKYNKKYMRFSIDHSLIYCSLKCVNNRTKDIIYDIYQNPNRYLSSDIIKYNQSKTLKYWQKRVILTHVNHFLINDITNIVSDYV